MITFKMLCWFQPYGSLYFSLCVIVFYRLVKSLTEIKYWYSKAAQYTKTSMSVLWETLLY